MILCEAGPGGQPVLFDRPVSVVTAWHAEEVRPALARAEALRKAGAWIAGWVGYEAGYTLEPRLTRAMPPDREVPLLVLGAFDGPGGTGPFLARAGAEATGVALAPLVPRIARADYDAAIGTVKALVAAGDCYQVNLTFPMDTALEAGTPVGLYGALRGAQDVGFGAFADFGPDGGAGPVVISRSPELFFACDANGGISARPMKGTAPRSADAAEDQGLRDGLAADPKAQAENLMIVDLLRNDIGRIAQVGSVTVPELFHVDTFATLHQMSSRVTARLADPPDLGVLMATLFPCGSVTGAPKIRAMEIIREVEPHPRGVYCGAIGWMAPDGSAAFNVAIRTLSLFEDGRIVLNVGGGVVHDSTAQGEWEEALWKARFAAGLIRA